MKIIIIIYLVLVSCKGTKSIDNVLNSECYKKLKSEVSIQSNWKYLSDSSYYKVNPSFIQKFKIEYKDCILQMSKQQVIDLFGEPTNIQEFPSKLKYSLSVKYLITPCKEKEVNDSNDCRSFVFLVGLDGKIAGTSFEQLIGSLHE